MIENNKDFITTKAWVKAFNEQIKNRSSLKSHLEIENTKSIIRHRNSLQKELENHKNLLKLS